MVTKQKTGAPYTISGPIVFPVRSHHVYKGEYSDLKL